MALSWERIVEYIESDYTMADLRLGMSITHRAQAYTQYSAGDALRCCGKLIDCLEDLHTAFQSMLTERNYGHTYSTYGIPLSSYLLTDPDYAPDFPTSWKSIVEAWIRDDFEGRAYTIATIDRMRQICWDEPFYIKWAARPESEPP